MSTAKWAAGLLIVMGSTCANAAVNLTPAGDGHDTVPVYVDGHGPYPFILDSGADGTAVYQWFAARERLARAGANPQELSGQTGATQVMMYGVNDLALDGRHLRHVTAFALPNRHDAGNEAGVLGNDFMDGTLVVYDFPCHRVTVHVKPVDPAGIVRGGTPPIRAGIDKGTTLLTLPVTVNGFTGVAVLDTGSRETRLTPAFARAAGIDASSAEFHDGEPIYGANSRRMIPRNGPIGTVRFGGVAIHGAQAQVIDLPVLEEDFGGKPAMLLGTDLLGRYRVIYDHEARNVWIRSSTCAAAP